MTITADTAVPVELEEVQTVAETMVEEETAEEVAEAGQKLVQCEEPECGKSFENNLRLGAHRRTHGYVSPNPKPTAKKSTKTVVPATVRALDDTLEAMRDRLLELLAGGTEVGRLTTENIRLSSELRQALAAVEKIDRQRARTVDGLKGKIDALTKRVQDAETQWFEDEKLLEEIVHILSTHSPLAAVAAITQALPARLLPADS